MTFARKNFVDEIKKLSNNFYKYLDFSLASLIEHILSYEHLPMKSEIAKDLGIPSYTLSRKLGFLRKLGVGFSINVDLNAIGLSRLIIILNESLELDEVLKGDDVTGRFLAFYAPIILPFQGTMLAYYLPSTISVNDVISKFKNVVSHDISSTSIYSKAKLTQHFDFMDRTYKINWDRLYKLFYGGFTPHKVIDLNLRRNVRFSFLDLLIIKELEKDPFNQVANISRELGISYSKVLRHYNVCISKIVKGFKLRLIPLPPESSLYTLIRVEGDYGSLCRLANTLSELPFIAGIYISFKGVMYVLAVMDPEILNNLLKYLKDLNVNYNTYLLDRSRRVSFTIPYTEYSKFSKSWNLQC